MPLQHRLRRSVRFLQVNAPVSELLERDCHAGHRAPHEGARPHDTEIAIEIFDLGLAGPWGRTIGAIEQMRLPLRPHRLQAVRTDTQ